MSKLINQGGFGCIFYPGFNCKGELQNSSKTISKLQINNFNGKNEILIGKLIKKKSDYKFFFSPSNNNCYVNLATLDKNVIKECNIISKNDSKYLLLEIPYIKNISFQKLFTNFLKTKKHILLIFFDTYEYICNAISHLIDLNIVHFDIKEQNILYSIKYENPIIIDYGISIPFDYLNNNNLKEYFYVYAPDYYIWPLEVHIINYLLHIKNTLDISDIKKIVVNYISTNISLSIFSSEFKKEYVNTCINYFKKFINYDKNHIIKNLLKFYKTWDLYALNILYLKFFGYFFHNGFYNSIIIVKLSQLLLINISPNPENRLSISDTIRHYKEIFYINESTVNYLELIQNFKYNSIPIDKMKKQLSVLYAKTS